MPVSQNILGMNARNYLYIRKYNFRGPKLNADDKLTTKRILIKNGIATPALITSFRDRRTLKNFDWTTLPPDGFALKPARGWGGGGIIAFKNWEGQAGYTVSDELMTADNIERHILDILDGAYSLQYLPDRAMIEELVVPHSFFKRITPLGLPDIRIIVLNCVPIMAMVRVPTQESGGTANLTRGALALGIDIRTGITNHAYYKHGPAPSYIPGTKVKVRGIKIPNWDKLLILAAKSQRVSKLGYAGIDLVLDEDRGPLVLEVNARPGLSIQSANHVSLRTRLERIEHMGLVTPERGVEMGKSLFADRSTANVQTKPKTVGVIETTILEGEKMIRAVEAKIDTGAYRTSIDQNLADELGFKEIKKKVQVSSASGEQYRKLVEVTFHLQGVKIKSEASVANRSKLNYPMIIGRLDLKKFLVDPTKNVPSEKVITKGEAKKKSTS